MMNLYANWGKRNLPRNAFYGDGTEIELEALNHIREIYENESIKFTWHRGDIMILDNILMTMEDLPIMGSVKLPWQ